MEKNYTVVSESNINGKVLEIETSNTTNEFLESVFSETGADVLIF